MKKKSLNHLLITLTLFFLFNNCAKDAANLKQAESVEKHILLNKEEALLFEKRSGGTYTLSEEELLKEVKLLYPDEKILSFQKTIYTPVINSKYISNVRVSDIDSIPFYYITSLTSTIDSVNILACADKRLATVLFHGPVFQHNNIIDQPGMNVILTATQSYVDSIINYYNKNGDSLYASAVKKYNATLPISEQIDIEENTQTNIDNGRTNTNANGRINIDYNNTIADNFRSEINRIEWIGSYVVKDWEIPESGHKKPLLQTQWDQGYPYNTQTPKAWWCEKNSPVGCVAIAIGQICAYHRTPNYWNGVWYEWKNISNKTSPNGSDAEKQTAHLLANIGNLVGMEYRCNESGANSQNALKQSALNQLGLNYSNQEIFFGIALPMNYDFNIIQNSINQNQPVYIDGCANRYEYWWLGWHYAHYNCHAWVLDGYLIRSRKMANKYNRYIRGRLVSTFETYYDETSNKVYANLGWGGITKADYEGGIFNTGNSNYQYKIGIFPYISKK